MSSFHDTLEFVVASVVTGDAERSSEARIRARRAIVDTFAVTVWVWTQW